MVFDNSAFQDFSDPRSNVLENILDSIISVARRGWGPLDLMHVCGKDIHALLYRVAARIPAELSNTYIRQQWLLLAPPRDPFYSTRRLEKWSQILPYLPFLPDSDHLVPGARKDHLTSQFGANKNEAATDPKQKIRHKIEALLKKAESTQFPEEAESLISKAQQLQQQYRLTEFTNLHNAGGDTFAIPENEIQVRRLRFSGPYVKQKSCLLGAICDANGASSILLHSGGIATVIGNKDDLDHVEDLFHSMLRQADFYMTAPSLADKQLWPTGKSRGKLTGSSKTTASYRRSFLLAYASRIGQLLHDANLAMGNTDELFDEPSSCSGRSGDADQAIVAIESLMATRQSQSMELMDTLFPQRASLSMSARNPLGIHDGILAAESSHLRGDSSGLRGSLAAIAS